MPPQAAKLASNKISEPPQAAKSLEWVLLPSYLTVPCFLQQQNMPVSLQSYSREGCVYVFDIIISIHEFC